MSQRLSRRRRGSTIIEVLVGIAVLTLGIMPIMDIFSGARRGVGTSREMLLLQSQALQVLTEGRAIVSSGELRQLDSTGEELLEGNRNGIKTTLRISRLAGGRLLLLFVHAETADRFYESFQVVSDPFSSFEMGLPPGGTP
jgi:hypothetical protein